MVVVVSTFVDTSSVQQLFCFLIFSFQDPVPGGLYSVLLGTSTVLSALHVLDIPNGVPIFLTTMMLLFLFAFTMMRNERERSRVSAFWFGFFPTLHFCKRKIFFGSCSYAFSVGTL